MEASKIATPEAVGSSLRSPRSTLEPWVPSSPSEKSAVLAQLELLLVHPLFFQSKRYPALLRFVVEQTLEGNAEQVKERSIGMDVFGRVPGYDANADPVVRVTAGEIRKRLAQYYYDPAHSEEIRIELPVGSYVPVFQRFIDVAPAEPLPERIGTNGFDGPPAFEHAQPIQTQPPIEQAPIWHAGKWPRVPDKNSHLIINILLAALSLAIGLGAGYWLHQYREAKFATAIPADQVAARAANQAVDDFWQPMTTGPATVTFCLGEPARDSSGDTDPAQTIRHPKLTEPLYFRLRQSGLFALADVITLTHMSAILQKQHKSFRVSAASEANFAQLREGPAVLIGAYDNLWTMRLTRDLRFGFDSVDGNAFIVDRKQSPKKDEKNDKTQWFTAWDLPYEKLARDYAIVARYRDSITGQPVVIAAGISEEGTEAAGELISNPADLASLLAKAPANWRNMNLEAVIETQVIDGHSGPPQIRAIEFW